MCPALLLQPGDIFHILHVIAPPKQAAAPDFSPDVMGDDVQARCEIVSALCSGSTKCLTHTCSKTWHAEQLVTCC